jgi:hypothetical protein
MYSKLFQTCRDLKKHNSLQNLEEKPVVSSDP